MTVGPPEPIGPDLEVVRLACGDTAATDQYPGPALVLTLQLNPTGWLIAGHGRSPVRPGWPPCQ